MKDKQYTKKEKATLIARVEKAVEELRETGCQVDFQAVSRKLGIARSTLYRNPTVRQIITRTREQQQLAANTLFHLQQEISALKARVEQLEEQLQELSNHAPKNS